jgi:tetratricopeptide (TPR) repeat protein
MLALRRVPLALAVLAVSTCGFGSDESNLYLETVRAFNRGLASLEAGLLDDARVEFEMATRLAPDEPAIWVNLGVAGLRLGLFDEATSQIARAVGLAPEDADLLLILGLAENARGQVDTAITHFRGAVALDADNVRARFALAEAVERRGGLGADDEAQQHIETLLASVSDNLAVRLERARLAAKRGDFPLLTVATEDLTGRGATWPSAAAQQLVALDDAVERGVVLDAARAIAFLRNVLARVPEYQDGLSAIRTAAELIAEPLERFRQLPVPTTVPSPADIALAFLPEPFTTAESASALVAFSLDESGTSVVLGTDGSVLRRIDVVGAEWPFPGGDDEVPATANGILPLDWNGDFRTDLFLAGQGGIRLLLQEDGASFVDATDAAWSGVAAAPVAAVGAWAADLEMDGDLDVVVGLNDGPPLVLQNNGDGTWVSVAQFTTVAGVRAMAWGDLDRDGDPDSALLDAAGVLHVFENRQAGRFDSWITANDLARWLALAIADSDADGRLELLGLDADGIVHRLTKDGDADWDGGDEIVTWQNFPAGATPGSYRLWLADLDNSGSLDVAASGGGTSRVWLAERNDGYAALLQVPVGEIFGVTDLTGDGRLDLLGLAADVPTQFRGEGTLDYHWHVLRPRAQLSAGDQRINTFGVGGEAEVRSGLLVQKQLLTGGPVHFGLGEHEVVDVARILWPNGVAQAEFNLAADTTLVAEQRLKGSCPWVFTWDGTGMQFVTDFLWRSPLGLRINAQDTAGIAQTEDWVKIRGDQLIPRDGVYDVRITGELWETNFFDHVSLLVVDHPSDIDVYVDERFSVPAPELSVRATTLPQTVAAAWDNTGREVTDLVRERDGRYLNTFTLGRYQGVTADEHAVEFELSDGVPTSGQVWLLAYGWVYPTDSSINVALGQGSFAPPKGLALDVLEPSGNWRTVHSDLGFPAGKNKTIMVDISDVARTAVRLRLRTNLEIYWDWLGHAGASDAGATRTIRLAPEKASLRYRGFSQTKFVSARGPEVPIYEALATTRQIWRDLEGYHTRFGDVSELLANIDDRYVIMNAGDELQFAFPAVPPPDNGWTRDFVLIGDGWVKDGDYNTTSSKTVGPLPSHEQTEYAMSLVDPVLEFDPVYLQHREDWQRFHTRYVTPRAFLNGLGGDTR